MANGIRRRRFASEWNAALREPGFRRHVFETLGPRFGIHSAEALEAASQAPRGLAHAVLRAMVFKRLREGGNALLENPKTWAGRPFIGALAGDLRERFAPSVAAILEKKLQGRLPK